MERLDRIVAIAGGVILAIAVVGVALGGGGGAMAPYELRFDEATESGEPIPLTIAPGGGAANATLQVPRANLTTLAVKAYVNATLFPTGATARVVVRTPDGVEHEQEGTSGAGPQPLGFLGVTVDVPLATLPAPRQVQAASADDAARAAGPANATATGEWLVDVEYSPSGPVPPQSVSVVVLSWWSWYEASASPAVPESR